jgi:hypothetical protein
MTAKTLPSNQVQNGHWGYYGDDESGWEVTGVERESLHLKRKDETQRISWAEAADQNWLWWTEK